VNGTLSVSIPQNEAPYTLFVVSSPFVKENSMGSLLGTKNFQGICLGNEDSCNVGAQVQEPNSQSCFQQGVEISCPMFQKNW